MYVFISKIAKRFYVSPNPEVSDEYIQIEITDNLEVTPIILWQTDGSIDYLETNRFGDVLKRTFVWYPLRFGEKPIVWAQALSSDIIAYPRVAMSRIVRLIASKRTFSDYLPVGISIYYDFKIPFYRLPVQNNLPESIYFERYRNSTEKLRNCGSDKTKGVEKNQTKNLIRRKSQDVIVQDGLGSCFNAITGARLKSIGLDVEEILYPSNYRTSSSKCFNLGFTFRPQDQKIYIYNLQTDNLITEVPLQYPYLKEVPIQTFSLGIFHGRMFFFPNPNCNKRIHRLNV